MSIGLSRHTSPGFLPSYVVFPALLFFCFAKRKVSKRKGESAKSLRAMKKLYAVGKSSLERHGADFRPLWVLLLSIQYCFGYTVY